MLATLVNQIRPHQLVHQLAVVVVLSGFFRVSPAVLLAAYGLAVLGTAAMLLLSDYQHRHEDARMGRARLVHVIGERPVRAGIGISLVGVVGLALVMGGARCLAFVGAVVLTTMVYTVAKKQRRPLASYLGRAAAGAVLVGVYAAVFTEVEIPAVGRLALAAGVLDLAGNLAGDLRDEEEDRRAGLRTLPLRVSLRWTVIVIVALLLVAHATVAASVREPSWLFASAIVGPLATVVAIAHLPRPWMHAAAHGPKLVQLLLIGAALQGTSTATTLGACLLVGTLWLASYWTYLWSLRRVRGGEPAVAGRTA